MPITNHLFLAGRLARAPELRYTGQGQAECTMIVCHNWTTGREARRMFLRVICYGAQAEACAKHLAKGSPVLVDGPLRSKTWKDAQGQEQNFFYLRAVSVNFLHAGVAIPAADEFPGVEIPGDG